jgi:hypothetical protein
MRSRPGAISAVECDRSEFGQAAGYSVTIVHLLAQLYRLVEQSLGLSKSTLVVRGAAEHLERLGDGPRVARQPCHPESLLTVRGRTVHVSIDEIHLAKQDQLVGLQPHRLEGAVIVDLENLLV